jgi:alpha-mannosidase
VRVIAGLERVDIVTTIDKEKVYDPEGVHLAFPFAVPGGTVRMDTPWAVVRPEADQMPGSCKNYFTVQRWVDVSNDARGITWATVDAPLIELGAITNDARAVGWIETLAPTTTLYSYVMNNYWETNYKASQEGPTVFRYALRPHGPYDQVAAQRFGIEQNQPLIAVPANNAPAMASTLQVTPDAVIVTSIRPIDNGAARLIRLFNTSEEAAEATVTWAGHAPQKVGMKAYAIKTVRVE